MSRVGRDMSVENRRRTAQHVEGSYQRMANNTSSDRLQPQPQKLLVDGMLGRLARWLRILGYDTVFERKADDWTLIHLARAEGRLLLTRDRQLATRRIVPTLLIESEELAAQVRQVIAVLGPSPTGAFSRCPVCNQRLMPLSHNKARDRVPAHVHRTQGKFCLCPECDRVYWQGTHWDRMKEILNNCKT